ncbi:pseudomurein-binding protein [Methanothermobacter tenebrarum]|uniref:Pseudomurein-binding protein n=2 Tax=Methanothermobacter tenebrarum TaxID=680118 RepID=A0A328PA02_9EURY|nr:pseudomurein-binding protein [Methanothermobacter tenebrarum]
MLCMVLAAVGTSYAQENTTTNFEMHDNNAQLSEEKINETPTIMGKNPKVNETSQQAAYNDEENVKAVEPSDIEDAAVRVNKFVQENGKLPKYVRIKNSEVSMPEYLYLLTASLKGGDTIIKNVEPPENSTGSTVAGSIKLNDYLELANRVYNFIKSENRAPSYATYQGFKIRFESLVWLFTKAINFKVTNQRLPNYIDLEKLNKIGTYTIDNNNPSSTSGSAANGNSIAIKDILNAAVSLKSFIEKNQRLPTYVQVANQKINLNQFLYLMAKSINQINNGKNTPISLIEANDAPNPSGTTTGELKLTEYVQVAKNVADFIETNRRSPNYVTTSIGKVYYPTIIYAMSRILTFYKENNRLPKIVTIKGVYNQNQNTNNEISQYLVATANCQVNDPSIQALAAQLTNGLTSEWDKAKAVFNWVRDNIDYSFYYNTKYGAVGTLRYRTANCCDHAHLVVALARAAGLPARYKHGICTFSSGTYGHVWAQIYIGGTWYDADATSIRNSLGVINNWNTTTGKILGTYASLPF